MAKAQKKLGEQLIEWGIITQKEVTKALDHAKAKNLRLGEALIVDIKDGIVFLRHKAYADGPRTQLKLQNSLNGK